MLTAIKNIFKSVVKHDEITVTLSELSSIWLKYNQNFQSQASGPKAQDADKLLSEGQAQDVVSVKETGQQTQDKVHTAAQGPRIKSTDFLNDLIEPYKNILTQQNAIEGVYKIIELLDEHGGCPSVVTTAVDRDSETDEIYSIRDILLKVSLKDHSYRVARIALKLLKDTYREKDYENLIPKMLVVSLGHDLGKIPALRASGLYAKADHPLISASKVNDIFMGKDIPWLNSATDAIKNHHRQTNDPFALLLKAADSRAREMEVAEVSKDISVKQWDAWFNVKSFLEILRPQINVVQTGNKWKAFSLGGIVYCQPDFLHKAARRLASEKKVIDMTLLKTSEKEMALRKIVNSLRDADAVGNGLAEGYYGRFYEVQMEKAKRRMFLTPLKIEAFGIPSEIERVKEGYLQMIKNVIPSKR